MGLGWPVVLKQCVLHIVPVSGCVPSSGFEDLFLVEVGIPASRARHSQRIYALARRAGPRRLRVWMTMARLKNYLL